MSKIFGLQGYLTGKLGNTVFVIRNGQQVARMYNPVVANPKSENQVATRAKLKLLSQLSAAVASVIVIRRKGAVSARNLFISRNFGFADYADSIADINQADIQLTNSAMGLPGFSADRSSGSEMAVELKEDASESYDRVVYVILRRTDAGGIAPVASLLVTNAGTNGTFPGSLPYVSGMISVHAYGIRLNTEVSRTAFGNLHVNTAEAVAKLLVSRTYTENDFTLSETRGLVMMSGETQKETSGVVRYLIAGVPYDNTNDIQNAGGTVTGGGYYEAGETATLIATPAANFTFKGWADSAGGTIISSNVTYSFEVTGRRTVYAVFEGVQLPVVRVYLGANAEGASVSGGGAYAEGESVTVVASPASISTYVNFKGWYTDAAGTGTRLSSNASYTFTMGAEDVTLYAVYEDTTPGPVTVALIMKKADGTDPSSSELTTAALGLSGTGVVSLGNGRFSVPVNTQVTLAASASVGSMDFAGWHRTTYDGELISASTSASLTITAQSQLVAVYQSGGE